MAGYGGPDDRTHSGDEIVYSLRRSSLVENLGDDLRVAGRQSGHELAGDLIDRPVPRRDQPDHADRLTPDAGPRYLQVLKRIGLQHLKPGLEMLVSNPNLHLSGKLGRRAQFLDKRISQILPALFILREHAPQ